MKQLTRSLCLLAALGSPARAADGKGIAPLLDERTVAVLRVEPGKFDLAGLIDRLAVGAKGGEELAGLKKEWSDWLKGIDPAGGKELFGIFSLADAVLGEPFLAVPLERGADEKALARHLGRLKQLDETLAVEKVGNVLVVAVPPTRQRLKALKVVPRPDVAKALAGAPAVRCVVVPTLDAARVLEEALPMLPEELGGGSVRPLSRGLRWLAADLVQTPGVGVRLSIQASDEAAAKDLDGLIGRAFKALAGNKEAVAALPALGKLPALWKPQRIKERLVVSLDEKALTEVLRPWVVQAIAAERQARAAARLRQILTAMHAYEGKARTFPAHASYDKGGKPLLSWRVHLLPHLGQGELYRQFRLDEPWDSPHNRKLIGRMPAVYRPASDALAAEHRTTYLAPLGEMTMFPGRHGLRIVDVTDGAANTILLVDAADRHAVVWTRPDDLKVDLKDPLRGLSTRHDGKLMVGFVDGTVRFLPDTVTKETLAAMLTRSLGEVPDLP